MIVILLILAFWFYVLPGIITYFGLRYQFKNEWPWLEPGLQEILIVFAPLINIGFALFYFLSVLFNGLDEVLNMADKKENKKTRKKASKFFKL